MVTKTLFDKEAMKTSNEDRYLEGTEFKWLFTLYSFDRDLRSLTFSYLDKAKAIMKNAVTYAFCEKRPDPEAYLDRSVYVDAQNMLFPKSFSGNKRRIHQRNLDKLIEALSKKRYESPKSFIKHYSIEYDFVPLWVLQKNLTFGNIYHFYQLQTRSIQNATCKKILEATNKNLRKNYLTPQKLLHAFSVLVDYRNLCAHGERLYCAKVGRSQDIPFSKLASNLRLVLPETEYREFLVKIINLFDAYGSSLHVVTNESLLCDMGFEIAGEA